MSYFDGDMSQFDQYHRNEDPRHESVPSSPYQSKVPIHHTPFISSHSSRVNQTLEEIIRQKVSEIMFPVHTDFHWRNHCQFDSIKLPLNFQAPKFRKYSGRGDPHHHINAFHLDARPFSDDEIMLIYLFPLSLEGIALQWFTSLTRNDLQTFPDIVQKFFNRFSFQARRAPSPADLVAEKMQPGEDFVRFVNQWRDMAIRSGISLPESQQVDMVIMNSCGDIKRALSLCDCNTFDQLFDRVVAIQRYSSPAPSYHVNEEAYFEAPKFQYPVHEHVEVVEMPTPIIRPPDGSPLPRWLQGRVRERDPNIRLRDSQSNHSPHQPYAYPTIEPEPIFTYHQPQPQPQPELSFDPTPAYEPPIVEITESTEYPIWDYEDEGFCDGELLELTYSNPNASPTYESPVVEITESDECPKWDYYDDEELCDGELLELIYPTPTPHEPTIQSLHPAEFECPLSPPAQDPIESKLIEPIPVISDDSNLDSSNSEVDPDPIESIVHVLESKPLIFRNAQFKEAVEPSQLPEPLDLSFHLSEELSPPDAPAISKSEFPATSKAISPAISKSITPLISKLDLIHTPLVAPIAKSLLPPLLGSQYHVNPSPLASDRSVIPPMACLSISISLLTDPSVRKHFLSAENLWQIRRHSRFRQFLMDAEQQWHRRRHTRFKLEKNGRAINATSDVSSVVPLKLLQFEPP
ncbi:hypothetical protein QJS10_CPB12g00992 [Acorus calamus]|uniref:Retrotransposon gag domain-containing protein n=1 Tax=Acorus calamus TaxID=4465 RepID=A0AAV9DL13_ACOCL|nr:hypothetical protein QJS10_CPB12g00992 [Acorus calamus]